MKKFIALFLLFPQLALAAPRVCATSCITQFDQGCYTGTGIAQAITTNITNPEVVYVYNVTNTPDFEFGVWRSRTMASPAADSTCYTTAFSPSTCGNTNLITTLTSTGFTVGTNPSVNQSGDPYCWYAWSGNRLMGSLNYVGDGTTPRTISTPVQPSFAAIQLADGSGVFGAGNFYLRTNAMPANTSFGWWVVGESPRTNVIRNLVSGGVEVGLSANVLGRTYYGWWTASEAGFSTTTNWTGNGNDLGNNCASSASTQVVDPGCEPLFAMTAGCQGNSLSCTDIDCIAAGHTGVQPLIRGTNMGTSVVGPGHLTNDFTSLLSVGGLRCCLGGFSSAGFTAAGDGSFAANLNDLNLLPYALVMCAPGCVNNP